MKKYYSYLLIAVVLIGVVAVNMLDSKQDAPALDYLESDFDGIKVISFSSPHCGACDGVKKEVEKVRGELGGDANFETVDVTTDTQTTDHYNVAVVPTILITYNGLEIERMTGPKSAKELSMKIKKEIGRPKYCEDGSAC